MRIAITGATGLLGNNLARLLLDQGHEVRIAVRPTSNLNSVDDLPVEIATGDLNDPDFAQQLVADCDGLIHVAGMIWFGLTRQEEAQRINVDATINLAKACMISSIRMVFVSSVDALAAGKKNEPANELCLDPPKSKSSYVVSKRKAERELLKLHSESNLDVVIANPGLMLGPYDWRPSSGKMILTVTDGYVPFAPSGGITVADVRQVAKGLFASLEKGNSGERYIFAGTNISYLKLWRKMAAMAGNKGPFAKLGPFNAMVVGRFCDLKTKLTGKESEVNSAAISVGSKYNYYESNKAAEQLDYDPGSLDKAIEDAWEWLKFNGYTKHTDG